MSSATSTDDIGADAAAPPSPPADTSLRPWQFFLMAGMFGATAAVFAATGQSPASLLVLSLTIIAASLVAVAAYGALLPLVSPEATEEPGQVVGRARAVIEREKLLVLRSIKELEFDFAMGKVSKNDFEDLSGRLRARAIGLIRQLDDGSGSGYRAVIEREVAARLSSQAPAPASPSSAGQDRFDDAAPACACGGSNDPDARFCKHCGNKLR
jgi:hypothetical protein